MNETDTVDIMIHTFSGKFYPFRPETYVDNIWPIDIAHSLSNICRYGGHSILFYSVAEHSCLVSNIARMLGKEVGMDERECSILGMYGLIHDSGEAYVQDIISPMRQLYPEHKNTEDDILSAVIEKIGMSIYYQGYLPSQVHDADMIALDIEMPLVFPRHNDVLEEYVSVNNTSSWQNTSIEFLTPSSANKRWLATYIGLAEELKLPVYL